MLDPIYLENDQVIVHAFRAEELVRLETLVKEIFLILSDPGTLRFLPEKRLDVLADAENWLRQTILNFHCGRNFLHFISDKRSGKILGMVDIFAPTTVKEYYHLKHYPHFVEFYLGSEARGNKIMTNLLPRLVAELKSRGINEVAAVVNTRNYPARKVLMDAGFINLGNFDQEQILFQYTPSGEKLFLQNVG